MIVAQKASFGAARCRRRGRRSLQVHAYTPPYGSPHPPLRGPPSPLEKAFYIQALGGNVRSDIVGTGVLDGPKVNEFDITKERAVLLLSFFFFVLRLFHCFFGPSGTPVPTGLCVHSAIGVRQTALVAQKASFGAARCRRRDAGPYRLVRT